MFWVFSRIAEIHYIKGEVCYKSHLFRQTSVTLQEKMNASFILVSDPSNTVLSPLMS